LAAARQAVDALEDLRMCGTAQVIAPDGIRTEADVAKALVMGADAVSTGQGMLVALDCTASVCNAP
jgi:glutamate synthase domain-containing protein 2